MSRSRRSIEMGLRRAGERRGTFRGSPFGGGSTGGADAHVGSSVVSRNLAHQGFPLIWCGRDRVDLAIRILARDDEIGTVELDPDLRTEIVLPQVRFALLHVTASKIKEAPPGGGT